MRRALLLAVLALAALPQAARAGEIVVFDDPNRSAGAETSERAARLGIDVEHRFSRAIEGFSADLSPAQVEQLKRDPEVAAVIPDRPVHARGTVPMATGDRVPPGIRRAAQLPVGQVHEQASNSVAVLDTGVDLDHPDLNVVAGANCAMAGAPDDVDGHGTHVAGTIAAKNNGIGVTGVAPGTKIVAVKVLDDDGSGSTSTVMCGIEWVLANRVLHDIRVVNLSLGGLGDETTCASPEHAVYCALANAGVVPVVAAGNDGWDFSQEPPDIPASYPEVLTVTAMADSDGVPGKLGANPTCDPGQPDDTASSFSNFSTKPADAAHVVAAPGTCIRSTYSLGRYATMSGTSMATPHVAGLVALCLGEAGATGPCDGLTTPQVIKRMVDTATAADENGFAGDPFTPVENRIYGPMAVLPTQAATGDAELVPPVEEDEEETTPVVEQPAAPTPVEPPVSAPVPAPEPTPITTQPIPTPIGTPRAEIDLAPRLALVGPARGALRRLRTRGLVLSLRATGPVRLTVTIAGRRQTLLAKPGRVTIRATAAFRRALARKRRVTLTVSGTGVVLRKTLR